MYSISVLGLDELGVHAVEHVGQIVVVGEVEGLVPVVAVEPEVNVEVVTNCSGDDRRSVELCFYSGVGVNCEEEGI